MLILVVYFHPRWCWRSSVLADSITLRGSVNGVEAGLGHVRRFPNYSWPMLVYRCLQFAAPSFSYFNIILLAGIIDHDCPFLKGHINALITNTTCVNISSNYHQIHSNPTILDSNSFGHIFSMSIYFVRHKFGAFHKWGIPNSWMGCFFFVEKCHLRMIWG